MAHGEQDQPFGTVTIVAGAATFQYGQSGVLANGNVIEVGKVQRRECVVSALAADGLTCTLTPVLTEGPVSFFYSGRQTSLRG